jgi:hypothetical protein
VRTEDREIIKTLQKKIGNLELTVHSMMAVLEEEDLMNQDRINRKAENIVKDMKHLDGEPVKKDISTDK